MFFMKKVAILFGILLFLGAAATVGLRIAFPPAKLRKLVEEQIRIRTGREAELGAVHLGLSGLTLEQLRLSEVPNFKAGTFLTAQGVHLEWSWRTICRGLHLRNLF